MSRFEISGGKKIGSRDSIVGVNSSGKCCIDKEE